MIFTLTLADISGDTWSEEVTAAPKTLGRGESTEIRLDHASVSRQHCRFWRDDSHCFVEDCGSTNGTFVNGIKIKRERLSAGDTILIGRFELVLERKDRVQRTIELPKDSDLPLTPLDQRTEEQHLARIVHRRLNPARRISLPGMVCEVAYYPSGMLGGDCFDTLDLKNRRVLALFDPMTHGVKAAMHSTLLRAELQRWITLAAEPARCLQWINAELVQLGVVDLYVQAAVASWFPRTQTFVYATAGGQPPMILRDGKVLNRDEFAGGLPLGVRLGEQFQEKLRQLKVGDRVFLFTDGLSEIVTRPGSSPVIAENLATQLEEVGQSPLRDQMRHITAQADSLDPLDDILLVGCEIVAS